MLASAALGIGGCGVTGAPEGVAPLAAAVPADHDDGRYGPMPGEKFPIEALDAARIDPAFRRQEVDYVATAPVGAIVVDPDAHFLYLIEAGGRARRYGVAVGRDGASWAGTTTIKTMQDWPDWYPTAEMLARRPDIKDMLKPLRSGLGIPGGPDNPIGARGLYLWDGKRDTLYRIHGTTEPYTIGQSVSSGCIRMTNQDVIDLYARVHPGTTVTVLPSIQPPPGPAVATQETATP